MVKVTPQSKKELLWQELERLRHEADQQRNLSAVLASEAERLREENGRLVERTRFMEELSGRVREVNEKLEILTSLTKELASFDVDGVLEVCVKRIPFLVGARFASVYLYDRANERLLLKHHTHGREIDRAVDLKAAPSSLMAIAVRSKEPLCIDDLGSFTLGEGQAPALHHRERYQTASCVVAPLVAAGEVEGVLNLADRFDHRPFDPAEQLALIRQACELMAVSLRNARLFDEVQRAARTDSLTKLLNHQAFSETLETEARRAFRYENELAVLACRVSGLRLINANFGHRAGDALIARVAALLGDNVRDVDFAGRTGGAEFGVILPEQALPGALTVARRLAAKMAEAQFEVEGARCELRAHFGVGVYRRRGTGAELFQEALEACDRARESAEPVGWDPRATEAS